MNKIERLKKITKNYLFEFLVLICIDFWARKIKIFSIRNIIVEMRDFLSWKLPEKMTDVIAFIFVRLFTIKVAFKVFSPQKGTFSAFSSGFENLPGNFRSVKNGQLFRKMKQRIFWSSQANFQPFFLTSVKHKVVLGFCMDYLAKNTAMPFIFDPNFQAGFFHK